MSVGDGLFRGLVVALCFGAVFEICLVSRRLAERPVGGMSVERGERGARQRRSAVGAAMLVLALTAVFATPVFVWPDVALAVSGPLIGCALLSPAVVFAGLAAPRVGVALAGWLAGALVLSGTLWLLGGSLIATASEPGRLEQEATLAAVRRIGEAFERWRRDQSDLAPVDPQAGIGDAAVGGSPSGEATTVSPPEPVETAPAESSAEGPAESPTEPSADDSPVAGPETIRLDLPRLRATALVSRLVPRYLDSLPVVDGWGHPLELRGDLDGRLRLSIRSPGRDGTWDADAYPLGVFDHAAYDQDVVWIDGLFVRQPG